MKKRKNPGHLLIFRPQLRREKAGIVARKKKGRKEKGLVSTFSFLHRKEGEGGGTPNQKGKKGERGDLRPFYPRILREKREKEKEKRSSRASLRGRKDRELFFPLIKSHIPAPDGKKKEREGTVARSGKKKRGGEKRLHTCIIIPADRG